MISLKKAIDFHGHLGPWLVIGLIMGEYGLKRIKAKKYFGLNINVKILDQKPRTCLIDGLQLSTGCTLGKGNIKIFPVKNGRIKINLINRIDNKRISLGLNRSIRKQLEEAKTHYQSEILAKRLYKMDPVKIIRILN